MTLLTRKRFYVWLGLYGMVAGVVVCVAPLIGSETLEWGRLWTEWGRGEWSRDLDILFALRAPRVVLAFLAGAGLALTGAVFQALLQNPLATPYTLGVAGGGSLGAVFWLYLPALVARVGWGRGQEWLESVRDGWGPFNGFQMCSMLFSAAVAWAIYRFSRRGGALSTAALLLSGVTLSLICSAAIMLIMYLSDPNDVMRITVWLMGGLDVTGWRGTLSVLPVLIPASLVLLAQAKALDQIALGEELAAGRGVAVDRLRRVCFFGGSLVTASVVAVTGPIGFVGLMAPHIVRRLTGPDHRLLLPCAFLGGGVFLVTCDTIARTAFSPAELPVGVITAMLGGPFFLYLLIRRPDLR